MSRNTAAIQSFAERIINVDPDLRQMALFDLQELLNSSEVVLSEPEQDKIVPHVLTAFTSREVNSEIHSQSVRLLATLVKKLSPKNRQKIAEHLVTCLWDQITETKNAEAIRTLRENALMGLKSLIEGLQDDHKETVQLVLVPRLLAGMKSTDSKIKADILDVLSELIRKFGKAISDKHASIQEAAIACFSGDQGLRKKGVACVANLCLFSSDDLFNQVLQLTLAGLNADRGEHLRRHIQLCNTITRVAADRFGSAVEKVIPLFFKELNRLQSASEEESQSVAADEVRENILQALDSFISRCPNHVGHLLPEIVDHCGVLVKWDPNFCEVDDVEETEDEELDDIDDDDDSSWKVRKSAARCLLSVVSSRPDQLPLLFEKLCSEHSSLLISRFKERVENVRLEVLSVFHAMLDASKLTVAADQASGSFQMSSYLVGGSFRMSIEPRDEVKLLFPVKSQLVNGLVSAAKHKSQKVKVAAFSILRDLFALIGAELSPFIVACSALVKSTLGDQKLALPQLRPEVLGFARVLVNVGVHLSDESKPENLEALESLFVPVFSVAEKDRYFKTVVAALRVCQEFVAIVRVSANPAKLAQDLFRCAFARLSTSDADQDVKRAAVDAMASILKSLEPSFKTMTAELEQTYKQLNVLLKNETTRLSVCKALLSINRCRIPGAVVKDFAAEMATFLRKSDRQLREAALRTLTAFIPQHQADVDSATLAAIITDLCGTDATALSEKELFLTSLGLQLLRAVCQVPSQSAAAGKTVAPRVIALVSSSLIQGQCVTDAANLFKTIASVDANLLGAVSSACKNADNTTIGNLAVLVGAVASTVPAPQRTAAINEFCALATTANKEVVGLSVLGELGRASDLSGTKAIEVMRNALGSSNEEVKAAASIAIGKAASSAAGKDILGVLLSDIKANTKQRYFLLRALKECLNTAVTQEQGSSAVSAQVEAIFTVLTDLSLTEEEGLVELIAECLGKAAHVDSSVIGLLAKLVAKPNENLVATAVAAVRHAATGAAKATLDDAINSHLPTFLGFLNESSALKVRRASIQLLTQISFAKPRFLLTENTKTCYIPSLLKELTVNQALISEVDLGPFKHVVDNGVELRKTAYDCVGTLIDNVGRSSSVLDFVGDYRGLVAKLSNGLGAPEADMEILSSVRGMLVKLSKTTAGQAAIMANLEKISEALKKTVTTAAKDGQDKDKIVEGQKHAVSCAIRLEAISGAAQNAKFVELMTSVRQSPHFAACAQASE
jgi:cullin-associated NEDD8-dissociated protein 1